MRSKIREHRGARVAGGETEPYLPPVPQYMPEAGWGEWLARLARNVNVLGQTSGASANTGGASVTTDDAAPVSPADGDLWWDSVGGQLYVWYDDPSTDAGQWVAATNMPGPAGPAATSRNTARLQAQWVTGAIVANDTVYLAYDAPYAGTINSLTYFTGNGSFTVAIQINGVSVTGLSALSISSATPSTTPATALNTFSVGGRITAVITGATGSPTDALLSLAVTWS